MIYPVNSLKHNQLVQATQESSRVAAGSSRLEHRTQRTGKAWVHAARCHYQIPLRVHTDSLFAEIVGGKSGDRGFIIKVAHLHRPSGKFLETQTHRHLYALKRQRQAHILPATILSRDEFVGSCSDYTSDRAIQSHNNNNNRE
ncbi:hypothetical protein TNCV_198871 [Trichonephila clavipes]|nr:hypothetical protein TNCV_198871 [Trichonephila clavipes]